MNMKEELKKLKSGDRVFVEPGHRTGCQPGWYEVDSVGRKFLTVRIFDYGKPHRFSLETGNSVHDSDSNARYNGYDYCLHLTREAYEEKKENKRVLALARDGIANLQRKTLLACDPDLDLAKDLLEVFKKHGLIDDQP